MLFPFGARVTWSTVLLAAFQWFQLVFGTFSNVIVLLVMAWRRYKLQVVTQMLIASLSLAGLGIMFSIGWVLPMTTIVNGSWIYGLTGCMTFYLFQTLSLNVSIWTLVVLAFER
jgi:7 transmembrane receptor (rhodopsin family)